MIKYEVIVELSTLSLTQLFTLLATFVANSLPYLATSISLTCISSFTSAHLGAPYMTDAHASMIPGSGL